MADDSLATLEQQWAAHESLCLEGESDERFLPFLPYDLNRFRDYLERTLALYAPKRFVDIGCGIGTKLLLVQRERSIPVFGIDRVSRYIAEARSLGVYVKVADAFEWNGYQAGDLVYLNCPCQSDDLEAELESLIFQRIISGSALFMVNAAVQPQGWRELWLDWANWCGAWVKPHSAAKEL